MPATLSGQGCADTYGPPSAQLPPMSMTERMDRNIEGDAAGPEREPAEEDDRGPEREAVVAGCDHALIVGGALDTVGGGYECRRHPRAIRSRHA